MRATKRRRESPRSGCVSPPVIEQAVETSAANVLHRVIGKTLVLTDGEDRHDVGVVQPGDRLRLAMKTLEPPGVELNLVDDLQRDIAPERFLDRLVDDSHSTSAQFTNDPEVAELCRHRA